VWQQMTRPWQNSGVWDLRNNKMNRIAKEPHHLRASA
jgi:hypothetical protein